MNRRRTMPPGARRSQRGAALLLAMLILALVTTLAAGMLWQQWRAVQVEEAGVLHEGIARGLAEDGALRLDIDGDERHFHAGEVSVRAQ